MKRISGTDTQFQLFLLLGLFLIGLLVLSSCNLSVAKMVVPTGAAQISTLYLAIPGQTTWYVAVDGNDNNHCLSLQAPCQHISAAVERAGPGDTIDIGAGSYLEGLVVEKSLNFIGAGWMIPLSAPMNCTRLFSSCWARGTRLEPSQYQCTI